MAIGQTQATGFLRPEATVSALVDAAQRAVAAWREPRAWRTLQMNGMSRDFGWANAARQYRDIYTSLKPGT
jgi:starch synthase